MVVDSAFGGDRGVGGGGRVATQTVVKVRTSVHHCEEDEGATEPLLAGTLLNIIQRWPWRDQDMVLRGDVRESVGNFLEGESAMELIKIVSIIIIGLVIGMVKWRRML